MWVSLVTYLGYSLLFIFGHFRDFLRRTGIEKTKTASELPKMKVSGGMNVALVFRLFQRIKRNWFASFVHLAGLSTAVPRF